MDKKAIEKLKKELLTKRFHDIFKNLQAIWKQRTVCDFTNRSNYIYTFINPNVKSSSPIKSVNIE